MRGWKTSAFHRVSVVGRRCFPLKLGWAEPFISTDILLVHICSSPCPTNLRDRWGHGISVCINWEFSDFLPQLFIEDLSNWKESHYTLPLVFAQTKLSWSTQALDRWSIRLLSFANWPCGHGHGHISALGCWALLCPAQERCWWLLMHPRLVDLYENSFFSFCQSLFLLSWVEWQTPFPFHLCVLAP